MKPIRLKVESGTVAGYISSISRRISMESRSATWVTLLTTIQTHLNFGSINEFIESFFKVYNDRDAGCITLAVCIAVNQLTPPEWLSKLAENPHSSIREGVARNLKAPRFTLVQLSTDKEPHVSQRAKQSLVRVSAVESLKDILIERLGPTVDESIIRNVSEDLISRRLQTEAEHRATGHTIPVEETEVPLPSPLDYEDEEIESDPRMQLKVSPPRVILKKQEQEQNF